MITLSHDAFDRVSLVRETVTPYVITCAQCGGLSKQGKLFRYGYLHDDLVLVAGLISWSKAFCSITCFRSYY